MQTVRNVNLLNDISVSRGENVPSFFSFSASRRLDAKVANKCLIFTLALKRFSHKSSSTLLSLCFVLLPAALKINHPV